MAWPPTREGRTRFVRSPGRCARSGHTTGSPALLGCALGAETGQGKGRDRPCPGQRCKAHWGWLWAGPPRTDPERQRRQQPSCEPMAAPRASSRTSQSGPAGRRAGRGSVGGQDRQWAGRSSLRHGDTGEHRSGGAAVGTLTTDAMWLQSGHPQGAGTCPQQAGSRLF